MGRKTVTRFKEWEMGLDGTDWDLILVVLFWDWDRGCWGIDEFYLLGP